MGPRVDRVLTTPHVVGGVVESHDLVQVHAVLLDGEAAQLSRRETVLVPIVLLPEHAPEKVVSEVGVEVLCL